MSCICEMIASRLYGPPQRSQAPISRSARGDRAARLEPESDTEDRETAPRKQSDP